VPAGPRGMWSRRSYVNGRSKSPLAGVRLIRAQRILSIFRKIGSRD
jgi:hypothetical protein